MTPLCGSLADGDERYPRPDGQSCECKDGWGGVNCNVCQSDNACRAFPIGELGTLSDDDIENNMTCYKGGETVFKSHQMCDVTNRKILDMLPNRAPQVSFSCDRQDATCGFEFWVAEVESFYCTLDTCKSSLEVGYDTNSTSYKCQNIQCKCVPGRFLCGEDGSVDIGDFLTDEIKGPASFSCKSGKDCKFEEPAMNDLIDQIFGDAYITLTCESGECMHYTQVPGYTRPERPDNSALVAISAAAAGLLFIIVTLGLWYMGHESTAKGFGQIRLPEEEAARLMTEHVPASLRFSSVSYTLGGRLILDSISGHLHPGQATAIMGASGAGKSTFLDILARKQKRGTVSGTMLVNGRIVEDAQFRRVMGFVDQEDTLMPTLTVYETVLYSALLRLPREMSLEAKKYRTLETLNELGILGIKDSRIGDSGKRSISGGEKRRVSIACELVTSPSILFLDEPTSGLDSYNAFNVVDSLVSLARDYNRTVVFTIHQPRSNIVAMFDQLILLARGKLVYSGEVAKCHDYFAGIGHPCPPGYNIADFLIDLTMQVDGQSPRAVSIAADTETNSEDDTGGLILDEERGLSNSGHIGRTASHASSSSRTEAAREETELRTRPNSLADSEGVVSNPPEGGAGNYIKRKTSQLLSTFSSGSTTAETPLSPLLAQLVQAYATSQIAADIRAEINSASQTQSQGGAGTPANGEQEAHPLESSRDIVEESVNVRGRRRASYATQFRILSGRAFKNLYRNPALLTAHYISSIAIALLCGFLFRNVSNDIPGFQNRLGVFFFTLALFGFSGLSSLGLFSGERILFIRERANGYYSSFTYFASKVLFDMLPLRVIPPLVFGGIVYGLIGFVPTVAAFWKFQLVLVLFNLTTASVVFLISVAFADISVASLIGTLIMLFNLLFAGLLINRESVSPAVAWVHNISFFHAAYEALAVNELRYLQLKEHKYGVDLDIPAAAILSTFGFKSLSFWFPNIALLGILFGSTLFASFLVLHFYVREKR